MTAVKQISAEEFKKWLDDGCLGEAADTRSWCEASMNPNFDRIQTGVDRINFEGAVEKVTLLRGICKKWESSLEFYVQDGNKIAARLICDMDFGNGPDKKELMFMAELDAQGRFEKVWEQTADYK